MDVLELLASDNFITFSKSIAKKYGVDAAILLGTMCSWQKFFGGEFYKSQEELKEETCLGIYEIKEAVKVLSGCGILTVTRKGLPAKNYYLVSANKLGENLLTRELETTQQEVEKSPNYNNKETIKKETSIKKQGEYSLRASREESEKVSPSIQSVFDFWNEQNIIVHRELTTPLITAIKKAIAEYSESSVKEFIKRYKTVLDDRSYFFSYKWSLLDFLTRKSGIATFTDEGNKWADYMAKREHKCLLDGTRIDEEDYPW